MFLAVVKLDGSVPVKYGMRLNMDSKYSAVKEHLSQLTGLPVCKLVLAEVASAQLKVRPEQLSEQSSRLLNEFAIQICISDADKIKAQYASPLYAYELPATLAIAESLDDEERSSLGSVGSRNSEAQTFTRIQRMTRPPAPADATSSQPFSLPSGKIVV